MFRTTTSPALVCLCLLCGATALAAAGPEDAGYPREHIYDTAVRGDETLVDVNVAFNRWPDCSTLESAVRDVFRLEGVTEKSDQAKALALWKWWRILVSATGGGYVYEVGNPRRPVTDPHKIFTVYGHHQCDGQSWSYVCLWRAAGYFALDECHWGHTIASLRYKDHDGKFRFHDFDPQGRFYYWDTKNQWVGTWTNPILRAKVHRHVMQPRHVHSGHTSLRVGETRLRKWTNEGHVVPSGRDKRKALENRYYRHEPGKTTGVYAAVGEEVQTLEAGAANLFTGSTNAASTDGLLHPEKAGKPAVFTWRMPKPNVVADAKIEATVRTGEGDTCRLLVSVDGETWQPVFAKQKPGEEKVAIDIGLDAWKNDRPNVYTAYTFYVKAELKAAADAESVGLRNVRLTAWRMLNKRTLPHLRPGENVVRATVGERRLPGQKVPAAKSRHRLGVEVRYKLNGEEHSERRVIPGTRSYVKIDVPKVPERVRKNYDKHWNEGPLQMVSIKLESVSRRAARRAGSFLRPADGEQAFALASPHPADMTRRKIVKTPETDARQTNGFFPQAGPGTKKPDDRMKELIELLNDGQPAPNGWRLGRQWLAAEDLGDYPAATDELLAVLPKANIDLTLFICKALARNPDKKMIPALLTKWDRAPRQSPGTRYVPDVLAAIGDRSVVPALVDKLEECRFDHRFHIAHALGLLGGPKAKAALRELAENDPFPAIRQEARRWLLDR